MNKYILKIVPFETRWQQLAFISSGLYLFLSFVLLIMAHFWPEYLIVMMGAVFMMALSLYSVLLFILIDFLKRTVRGKRKQNETI